MTHSHHTLSILKGDHSEEKDNRPAPEYMDINTDDAEAGSILMSLAQNTKQSTTAPITASTASSTRTASTMSIRNLLGDEDQPLETNRRTKFQPSGNTPPYTTWSHNEGYMHRYPESKHVRGENERSNVHTLSCPATKASPPPQQSGYSFERRQHGMHHAQPTHLLPAAPTLMRSTDISAHGPSERNDWQQRPQSHIYHTQRHHSFKPSHNPSPSYSQQSYQSMKKNPKIRRNALHTYISYLIYSDLMRAKANPTSHHPYNRPPMTRPPSITEIKPEHQSTHHQQPPLTAFLKQYVDPPLIHQSVTTPTTPRPKQVFPVPQQPYYSPPSTSRPQYYHSQAPSPPFNYSPSQLNRNRRC